MIKQSQINDTSKTDRRKNRQTLKRFFSIPEPNQSSINIMTKHLPMFKPRTIKHKNSPRANSGSSAAASDISVSLTSWLIAGSSIDIARACCSRAFSSSCFQLKISSRRSHTTVGHSFMGRMKTKQEN